MDLERKSHGSISCTRHPFLITSSDYYEGRFEEGSLKAEMDQNSPNPFKEKASIGCFIPETVMKAELLIFNMQGVLMKTFEISGRNQTEVIISGAEFNPGMYIYSLVLDNREIDSKRMILTE